MSWGLRKQIADLKAECNTLKYLVKAYQEDHSLTEFGYSKCGCRLCGRADEALDKPAKL